MIVLFFDIVLLLIVMNLNYVMFKTVINTYFDFCIFLYLIFCIFILPVILMIKKNKQTLKFHFISLVIINITVFYSYHLTLRSLFFSFFILETLFLYFHYIHICEKSRC